MDTHQIVLTSSKNVKYFPFVGRLYQKVIPRSEIIYSQIAHLVTEAFVP